MIEINLNQKWKLISILRDLISDRLKNTDKTFPTFKLIFKGDLLTINESNCKEHMYVTMAGSYCLTLEEHLSCITETKDDLIELQKLIIRLL